MGGLCGGYREWLQFGGWCPISTTKSEILKVDVSAYVEFVVITSLTAPMAINEYRTVMCFQTPTC